MSTAIEIMHVVGDASSRLARLPAAAAEPNTHAGMTFTMLRGVEPLLPGDAERRLLTERAADLARASKNIIPSLTGRIEKARDALARL